MAVRIWQYGTQLVAHGATWDFLPGKTREDFKDAYEKNEVHAERDFGANPPQSVQSALHNSHIVEELYNKERVSPVDDNGEFLGWFKGDPKTEYFMHIDMSMSTDNTGMAIVHYDFETDKYVADLIHTLVKHKDWKLTFERIFQIILALKNQLGFNLVKVTFDSWQSFSTIERLINAGINASVYSVDRGTEAYDTLIELLLLNKFDYYFQAWFIQEMKALKLYKGSKYDHPAGGSKDTSDGVAGAAANCVKARVGLALTSIEVDQATHEEHSYVVEEARPLDDKGSKYFKLSTEKLLENFDRVRKRVVRIDAVDDYLIMVVGWNDKVNQRLYVDEFLVWEDYTNQETLTFFQQFVQGLLHLSTIDAFSLNAYVPIEVVNYLRGTGRRVSSPLAARNVSSKGANRVAKVGEISDTIVRMMVSQMKKGNLTIPGDAGPLIKDLKFMTNERTTERKFVAALAGWTDFISREMTYGHGATTMPRPTSAVSAPINPAVSQQKPTRTSVRTGAPDIDRIRLKYNQSLGVPPVAAKPTGDNQTKRLPRIRKVRR